MNFMKKLIAIFVVLSLVSCNQNQIVSKEQGTKNEEILDKKFGKQLIDSQYLKYAEPSKIVYIIAIVVSVLMTILFWNLGFIITLSFGLPMLIFLY